jgi:dihydrofolate reductase
MTVNLIAAVGKHGQLGLNNSLPFRDSNDLRWFSKLTCENRYDIIVMGANTYKSITQNYATVESPPLKGRNLIVHHHDRTELREWQHFPNFIDYKVKDLPPSTPLDVIEANKDKNIWIIGGLQIYKLYMPYIERFYISRIDYDGPADIYFDILNNEIVNEGM